MADLEKLLIENLSNENVTVELRKCISKEGKIYYGWFVNDSRVAFLEVPQIIFGYRKLINDISKETK